MKEEHVFLPLIRQVNDNLKSYYSIFYSVKWTPEVGKYTQFNDIDGNVVDDNYYSSIHFTFFIGIAVKFLRSSLRVIIPT